MKKLLITLVILAFCGNFSHAQSDLRTMFQNNEAIIYSINLRTFNANDIDGNEIIDFSNGETSGTFLNAIERLDELKDLGINTLHFLPITPVGKIKALGSAGSLYAMSDFTTLNPQLIDTTSELSAKEQAKKLIDECHKRNIKVIVDLPSCGAYDLFINRPDLFVINEKDSSAFVPADWTDVRLFNVPNNSKLLKSDIFMLHKFFIHNMLELGFDGLRADVATIKPYKFWSELISYTREKAPNFLFLAEASESWTKPASERAYFTDYKQLMSAGFDGYYGNYFELKDWKTFDKLQNSVISQQKQLKKYKEKKSLIGSFATHDVVSPILTGGENFSKMIIWLNATLPLNPYYVDGFLQADDYIYEYSNKKANETYTDDEYYYTHKGQLDIFNFSRKPGSENTSLIEEQKQAIKIRNLFNEQITKGEFIPLKSKNKEIFAYQRTYKDKSIVLIFNRNLINSNEIDIKLKKINKKTIVNFEKEPTGASLIKSRLTGKLKPAEIILITLQEQI
ncbi:MAG: hypothetical protein E7Z90_04870 [Cyanobacteria bacterium SIG29]|nr:hypothetical protein [Cyanobacteria bacterium SIG29]